MQLKKIREKAKALGLDTVHLKKSALIHAIQIAEGNFPCFRTATDFCDQSGCCWRDDCLSPRWREEATELERLTGTLENLKTTTDKLLNKRKRDISKKAWKNSKKDIEASWEEIIKALKELSARL